MTELDLSVSHSYRKKEPFKIYMDGARCGSWELQLAWENAGKDAHFGQRSLVATQLAGLSAHVEQLGMQNAALLLNECADFSLSLLLAQAVADEARHAEVFSRYVILTGGTIPKNSEDPVELDAHFNAISQFDHMLASHVFLEALALEEFGILIDAFDGMFLSDIYRGVRKDEARHVAGGLGYLRSLTNSNPEKGEELVSHLYSSLDVLGVEDEGIQHLAEVSGLTEDYIRSRMDRQTTNFLRKLSGAEVQ